ncbi:MAG: Mut7-C RNAse domain-containing protein [Spirochaetaceae bacterium]
MNEATIRLYEELNRFTSRDHGEEREHRTRFIGNPGVKDLIESLGVPHTEVDMILVNGESVGFDHRVQDGDRIAVYPVFESLEVGEVSRVRATPLREPRFILDVHLGKLARLLRLLGFDTLYDNCWDDPEIVQRALAEHRIILTRDAGLLKRREVTHGYLVRSGESVEQAVEVLRRFDLARRIEPFRRCTACNGLIEPVPREEVEEELLPGTRESYTEFYRCRSCRRVYWRGSHYDAMREKIEGLLART